MAKVFYTERDIEDLARQGVTSLTVTDDVVVTDLAREKARRLGVALVSERDSQQAGSSAKPRVPVAPPSAAKMHAMLAAPSGSELEARIYSAVKAKLGSQVDDALLRTIVKRVLKSLGKS
jgi:hypothetical protein